MGIFKGPPSYSVKYIRLPDLLNELAVARGEGIYQKVMKQYKKVSLLILDEWLLVPLTNSEARDHLEIVEARHKKGSTILVRNSLTGVGTARLVFSGISKKLRCLIFMFSEHPIIRGKLPSRRECKSNPITYKF